MKHILLATLLALAACAPQTANYDDIIRAHDARLAAITEQHKAGRITATEARALAAESEARANTDIEMRRAARSIR